MSKARTWVEYSYSFVGGRLVVIGGWYLDGWRWEFRGPEWGTAGSNLTRACSCYEDGSWWTWNGIEVSLGRIRFEVRWLVHKFQDAP